MSQRIRVIITVAIVGCALLALLAVGVVGVTAATLPGCESCHLTGDFGKHTGTSAHSSVACVDCHVRPDVTGRFGFASRVVFGMVTPLGRTDDRSFAQVPSERCLSCHDIVVKPGVTEARGVRIAHATCAAGAECTQCHSMTAHGASTSWPRVAQMEECYACHSERTKKAGCDVCHASRGERERTQAGSFRVTHGPNWQSTHGMGRMDSCPACHEDSKCAGCHGAGVPHGGEFLKRHASYSTGEDAKCTSCHREEFCADCHSYPMPHDRDFTLDHAKTVAADGQRKCLTCHEEADCTGCHVSHVHPVTIEQIEGMAPRRGGGR